MYPQTRKKVVQLELDNTHALISDLFIYQVASGRAMADACPDLPSKRGNTSQGLQEKWL